MRRIDLRYRETHLRGVALVVAGALLFLVPNGAAAQPAPAAAALAALLGDSIDELMHLAGCFDTNSSCCNARSPRLRATRFDRIALVVLAAVTPTWRNVLRIVQPETLLSATTAHHPSRLSGVGAADQARRGRSLRKPSR